VIYGKERVRKYGIRTGQIRGIFKGKSIARAREACVNIGMMQLGMAGEELAEKLNKTRSGISRAYYRASEWMKGDAE